MLEGGVERGYLWLGGGVVQGVLGVRERRAHGQEQQEGVQLHASRQGREVINRFNFVDEELWCCLPKENYRAPPRPPVGSRYSCQPTVKLHILPLVWIVPLGKG